MSLDCTPENKYLNASLDSTSISREYSYVIRMLRSRTKDGNKKFSVLKDILKTSTSSFIPHAGFGAASTSMLKRFEHEIVLKTEFITKYQGEATSHTDSCPEADAKAENYKIEELQFNSEMIHKLKSAGIHTVGDFIQCPITDLEKIQTGNIALDEDFLNCKIEELKSPRLANALKDGGINTVGDLIKLNELDLKKLPNMGKKSLDEIKEFLSGKNLHLGMSFYVIQRNPSPVVPSHGKNEKLSKVEKIEINFPKLEETLIEDIERFLIGLSEIDREIAMSRWEFVVDSKTLEELGAISHVTRERIRQKQSRINERLIDSLTIKPEVIMQYLTENIECDFRECLPNFYLCFRSAEKFYNMLELLSGAEKNYFKSKHLPEVNLDVLDEYFCMNVSPVKFDDIADYLELTYGFSRRASLNIINTLIENNRLKTGVDGLYPVNLNKSVAAAHALVFHANGLPWKDLSRVVNRNGYSSTQFDEGRMISHYTSDSDYVYLSARGVYKNIKYLDISSIDIPSLMNELIIFLEAKGGDTGLLNDFHNRANSRIKSIDYYELRHIARLYGREYGIFFNGRSGRDRLSLTGKFSGISQKELILELLSASESALTVSEIALSIKSKSTRHATLYLRALMKEAKAVRVDQMMYTTPERAFAKIDTIKILCFIDDILIRHPDKIIDIDFLCRELNREFNYSYPKYFYGALASLNKSDFGWSMSNNLIGYGHIPPGGVSALLDIICKPELTDEENAHAIRARVLTTNNSIKTNIANWRQKLKMRSHGMN